MAGLSPTGFWSKANRNGTQKGRTTSSGVRDQSGWASPLGTTPMPPKSVTSKRQKLNAENSGVEVVPDGQTGARSLEVAVADYLADVKLTHKPRSYTAYNTALVYFMESCHKLNIKDIER